MKKALIIQNKYLGDVLVASLIAKNLKRIVPDIEVHFFCYDKAHAILENNPYIDKIIYFDNKNLENIRVLWKYTQQIRKENYDYLFDPYSKLQSRFITLFSNAKMKISYDKPFFNFLYDYPIKEEKKPKFVSCTSIENRLRLLLPLESDMSTFDFQTEIFLSTDEKRKAKNEMEKKGVDFNLPIIMIGVLGSSLTKSLPTEKMASLLNFLTENYDANFLLNYVPNQQKEVDKIIQHVHQPEKLLLDILGENVRELLSIMSHVNIMIGNEGGAINMAKALKVPTFALFSPHKFREDWGCYENEAIHSSYHLEDDEPEYLFNFNLKATIKDPSHLYDKINVASIFPKLQEFLSTLGIESKNRLILKAPNSFKPKISALLITKNEQKNIETYLEDLDFADEIIIVDSYSSDETKALATKNKKVTFLERRFDNFSNQKNYAIEQAQYPWILFFDTDEHVSKTLRAEIIQTINSQPQFDAYFVKRKFYFLNKPMNYSGWQNDKAIRLFKNGKGKYCEKKFVHETLEVNGETGFLKTPADHYSLQNLESYQKKLDHYANLKALELYKKGKKANFIHYHLKPIYRFLHHYIIRFGFLDGKNGYTIAKLYKNYVAKRYHYLDQYWKKA